MTPSPEIEKHNAYLRSLKPLDPTSFPFTNIPPPPSPDAYCSLSLIRSGNGTKFPSWFILESEKEGVVRNLPANCFLIEKEKDGKVIRLQFELGFRNSKDHTKPQYIKLGEFMAATFTPGVAKILQANNIPPESISTVIFGHTHFDHIGNYASLPSASIVIGPDSLGDLAGDDALKALADELDVPLSVVQSRSVRVLGRTEDKWQPVGSMSGLDYFGDGSLWILDTPGHKAGHITALVRTSTSPPAYHLLGSDTCHACSLMHPYDNDDEHNPDPAAAAALIPLTAWDPSADPDKLTSMHDDLEKAYESMAKVGRFDLEPDVNAFLSHDASIDVMFPPGHFVRLDGSIEELKRLKARDRSVLVPHQST